MTWMYCPECGKPGLTCSCPRKSDQQFIKIPLPSDPQMARPCPACGTKMTPNVSHTCSPNVCVACGHFSGSHTTRGLVGSACRDGFADGRLCGCPGYIPGPSSRPAPVIQQPEMAGTSLFWTCQGCGRGRLPGVPCTFCNAGRVFVSPAPAIKDSGERVTHTTGAVRDSAAGRGRYDLISPIMMERLAKHLEAGAKKYEERNWEKGLPIARMFASLFRHSWQAFSGQTDEDHLAAVICNAMFIVHTLEMIQRGRLPESLNDLPNYTEEKSGGSTQAAYVDLWHAFSEFRNHIALACTCLSGHTCANCKILKAADVALGR